MSWNKPKHGLAFTLVHWLLALAVLASLGLGWRAHFLPMSGDERALVDELHISLGLTAAGLLVVAVLLQIFSRQPAPPSAAPHWSEAAAPWLNALLYLLVAVMVASGYLGLVFTGETIEFWGAPLPNWGEPNDRLVELSSNVHRIAAYMLVAVLLAHIVVAVAGALRRSEAKGVGGFPAPLAADSLAERIGRDLARKMNLLGWAGFWLQFVFAFLSGLLLQIATAGRMLSAANAGIGDALSWSGCALLVLLFTCALMFYYTRRAHRLAAAPQYCLDKNDNSGLWYLTAGIGLGLLGLLSSFGGVALSIVLLIAKTVSQPPGIAITDPTKIIRALDIFVLLMSFLLLIAHFIGFGISLWLRVSLASARGRYRKGSAKAGDLSNS